MKCSATSCLPSNSCFLLPKLRDALNPFLEEDGKTRLGSIRSYSSSDSLQAFLGSCTTCGRMSTWCQCFIPFINHCIVYEEDGQQLGQIFQTTQMRVFWFVISLLSWRFSLRVFVLWWSLYVHWKGYTDASQNKMKRLVGLHQFRISK